MIILTVYFIEKFSHLISKITHERKLENYWKLASVCKTNEDKINFWDLYQEAFELSPQTEEELKKVKIYFETDWGIDLDEYEKRHSDYPNDFKIIAFEACILNGVLYANMKDIFGFYG